MKHIFVSILAGLPKEIAQVVESDATGRPPPIILFSLLNILLPNDWDANMAVSILYKEKR